MTFPRSIPAPPRRRRKRFDWFEFVTGLITLLAVLYFSAWTVMLMLGALHAESGWPCNLSYWASYALVAVVYCATAPGRLDLDK